MGYIALKPFKVQGADGKMRMAKAGEPVPEADSWPKPGAWIKRGFIGLEDDGGKAKRVRPPRAVPQPPAPPADPTPPAAEDEPASGQAFGREELEGSKKAELVSVAEAMGLDASGTKAELVDAILAAQG